MKRRFILIISTVVIMAFFAGCGKSVELMEEESDIISQYAASLLLKYDVNYKDSLKAEQEVLEKENSKNPVEKEEEKKEEDKPVGDPGEEKPSENKDNIKASLTEVFVQDGIEVVYKDCQFASCYPKGATSGFKMTAEKGQKLAILRFAVKNISEQVKKCDILGGIPTFKVTVNGITTPARMTILLEDLSTTCEEIQPGATVEKVLICQTGEELPEKVEQLEILATFHQKSSKVSLVP